MKIGILGSSLTSRDEAPLNDTSWEWWSMNDLFRTFNGVKWSLWFEIHDILKEGEVWLRRKQKSFRYLEVTDYIDNLAKLPCQVVMQKRWLEIPNSIAYPLNKVLELHRSLFTGTLCYMIPLIINRKASTIGLWGIDLSLEGEYEEQRPATWYWLGKLEGLGIELVIPDSSDLLKCRSLYGFEDEEEEQFVTKIKANIAALEKSHMKMLDDKLAVTRAEAETSGAIQALNSLLKLWR
jgi:hypothetical protein